MDSVFSTSRERFDQVLAYLEGDDAQALTHAELEDQLQAKGRELLRQLYQDHLDLRAQREHRLEQVTDALGVAHRAVEADHPRALSTVFGDVCVRRLAYRSKGAANLHPADAALNLPDEKHSHGLRRLAAIESARGSFDTAVDAIARATGVGVGKRQVEELTTTSACDVEAFYAARGRPQGDPSDVLVILR